jgi:excisionase family DNA binding protein
MMSPDDEMRDSTTAIVNAFGIEPHKLYPVEEVADLLSVEKKLIRWWIKKGSVEGIKLPNRAWRIRGIEIVRLLEQGRSKPK